MIVSSDVPLASESKETRKGAIPKQVSEEEVVRSSRSRPRRPSPTTTSTLRNRIGTVLDAVAEQVHPNDLSLAEWTRQYLVSHRNRLLDDLILVAGQTDPGGRLLEIGSNPPFVTATLSQLGFDVTGVDISPERFANSIAQLGLTVVRCDIERERMPFEDWAFDTILMSEVFEHLRLDLISTMEEVRRVLAPGGLLILATPNLLSFRGWRNLVLHQRASGVSADPFTEYSKLRSLGHMGHVREYTSREVASFLESSGWQVVRVVYTEPSPRRIVRLISGLLKPLGSHFTVLARPLSNIDAGPRDSRSGVR
jgi:SAM-dependent methyltransferase